MDYFSYDSQELLKFFAKHGKLVKLPKNQIIIDPYHKNSYMYYIHSGYVRSYTLTHEGKNNLLIIYGSNELFPFRMEDFPLNGNIFYETKTTAELWKMPKRTYEKEIRQNLKFAHESLLQMQIFIEVYRNTIESLQYRTAKEQIISKLVFLGWRFGDDNKVIDAPITHQDLADFLGLSRETVSRVVEKLQDEGLIKSQKRRIILLNYSKILSIL